MSLNTRSWPPVAELKIKTKKKRWRKKILCSQGLSLESLSFPPLPPPPSFTTPQRGRNENKKLVYVFSQTLKW
jgi:hypothetical protein